MSDTSTGVVAAGITTLTRDAESAAPALNSWVEVTKPAIRRTHLWRTGKSPSLANSIRAASWVIGE
jgi:hypothetical protein